MHLNVSFGVAPPQSNSGSRALLVTLSRRSHRVFSILGDRKGKQTFYAGRNTDSDCGHASPSNTNLVEGPSIILLTQENISDMPNSRFLASENAGTVLFSQSLSVVAAPGGTALRLSTHTRTVQEAPGQYNVDRPSPRLFSLTLHSSNKDHQTSVKTPKNFGGLTLSSSFLSGHNTRSPHPMGGPSTDGDLVGDFCRRNLPLVPDLRTSQALSASMASANTFTDPDDVWLSLAFRRLSRFLTGYDKMFSTARQFGVPHVSLPVIPLLSALYPGLPLIDPRGLCCCASL